ncbi:formin-homology 2 domain-containing protein [Thraustotheca clavata]|uniref:Formin-homology 2 domain-containing protein n=1 Tax=Thraustotheca clavata TaxID=74557 RepID=A0A1V9ZFY4_9STRA|nr:formin-homology 2 domain-containing protein [Thraustotheca clavata]
MHLLPLHQKWQIIQDWKLKQCTKEATEPLVWVQTLHEAVEDIASFSEQDARELHVLMRGSDKEWLTQFQKEDGIAALTELTALYLAMDDMDLYITRLQECLKCFKSLMNNNVGMELLLGTPDAIQTVVLSLDFETPTRRDMNLMVLEMLSLTCWFSELGHGTVLEAMELYRRRHNEKLRYLSLVHCIETSSSVELQTACLTFINTLVSTCARLDDRVAVRNDFLRLDLLALCHAIDSQLRSLTPSTLEYGMYGQGDAEQHAAKVFTKQMQVFEGLMRSDLEETLCAGINLSDINAVVGKLVSAATEFGFADRLLHVLLGLMTIPNEVSLGSMMWAKMEEAALEITSCSYPILARQSQLSFASITHLLATQNQLDPAMSGNEIEEMDTLKQKENELLRDQLAEASNRIQELEKFSSDLRHQLDQSVKMNSQVKVEAPPFVKSDSPSNDIAYEKYFKLLKMGMPLEQVQLKAKSEGLDPAKLSPAAPAVQVEITNDAAYEKYFKLLKMGMPLEQVQLKAKAEGLDPTKLCKNAPPTEIAESSIPQTTVATDPAYDKYFKLLKMGMPLDQVKLKVKAEGLDPSKIDQPQQPASETPETSSEPLDPKYDKFFKLLKMGMPLEQVKLKAKAEGLDPFKLDQPQKPASGAPVATRELLDPKYDKFFKLLKMGMPLEQVKLKAKAEGLDESKITLQGNSTELPATKVEKSIDVPPKKPAATSTSTPAPAQKSKLPPKKTRAPTTKMRNLYWTPLPDSCVEGSIWATMDEAAISIDWNALEKEFSQEPAKSSTKSMVQEESTKPKIVCLVDAKRQQNCSIAISRFRMTPNDIKKAILALDFSVLSPERYEILNLLFCLCWVYSVAILEGVLPTPDEIELIKGYDSDVSVLGETEKLFLALIDIPRLNQRLQSLTTSFTFPQRYDDIKVKLKVLEKAHASLTGSDALVQILRVILAVGNYLNGGTCRGGIYGFKLDILPKLSQVKATSSPNKTLLHAIADILVHKQPESLRIFDMLGSLESASIVSLNQLQNDFNSLERSLELVHKEVDQQNEAYRKCMATFVSKNLKEIQSLKTELGAYNNKLTALTKLYGVDPTKPSEQVGSQSFFSTWWDFVKQLKSAVDDNGRRRDQEPEVDAGLFNQFSESLEGDATDIMAKFRKRHQKDMAKAVTNELTLKLAHRRQSTLVPKLKK